MTGNHIHEVAAVYNEKKPEKMENEMHYQSKNMRAETFIAATANVLNKDA